MRATDGVVAPDARIETCAYVHRHRGNGIIARRSAGHRVGEHIRADGALGSIEKTVLQHHVVAVRPYTGAVRIRTQCSKEVHLGIGGANVQDSIVARLGRPNFRDREPRRVVGTCTGANSDVEEHAAAVRCRVVQRSMGRGGRPVPPPRTPALRIARQLGDHAEGTFDRTECIAVVVTGERRSGLGDKDGGRGVRTRGLAYNGIGIVSLYVDGGIVNRPMGHWWHTESP